MAKDKGKKKEASAEHEAALQPAGPPRLKLKYEQEVRPKFASDHGLENPMSHPRLDKVVINVNMGRFLEGGKVPNSVRDQIVRTITEISGQRPVVIRAKKSVSNFKVREGMDTAAMVTLRRERMWHFVDRFFNLTCPRIKDFRGLNDRSFDHAGNYSVGLSEQGVFPEIDMANAACTHGMHINFVFSNSNPELSKQMLTELGMPFRRPEEN